MLEETVAKICLLLFGFAVAWFWCRDGKPQSVVSGTPTDNLLDACRQLHDCLDCLEAEIKTEIAQHSQEVPVCFSPEERAAYPAARFDGEGKIKP